MDRMAVLSGSVRSSYRLRDSCWPGDAGEYRFWNVWGLKVLKPVLPRVPAAMQGNTEHVLSLYGGKETYIRCFFGEAVSRVGDAGQQGSGCWVGVQVWA